MLNRRLRDALKYAAGEDVPGQAVRASALIDLSARGFVKLIRVSDQEQKVEITDAGRLALAESQ